MAKHVDHAAILHKRVLKAMKRQRMSQYRLSQLSGVPQTTLSGFLRSGNDPKYSTAAKLLEVLEDGA